MTISYQGALSLLGAGKMGAALLGGWVPDKIDHRQVRIIDPTPCESAQKLIDSYNLSLNMKPEPAGILVVAVKPQIMEEVLSRSQNYINEDTLVISIAAGQTLSAIEKMLPLKCAVIRTMPNTPAEIGMGMTVACANDLVRQEQKDVCDQLMRAVGEVGWVEEETLMDAVTAVSGSGPAYLFHFTECLTQAGIAAGLDAELAEKLARQTVSGSGALLAQSGLAASQLRENVTSPGGTTAAALDILMSEEGLSSLLKKAIFAAKKRSKELSS